MLNVPGIVVTDPEALRAWLETEEHEYQCIGYSEGQLCCLDKLLPDSPER